MSCVCVRVLATNIIKSIQVNKLLYGALELYQFVTLYVLALQSSESFKLSTAAEIRSFFVAVSNKNCTNSQINSKFSKQIHSAGFCCDDCIKNGQTTLSYLALCLCARL